MKSKIIHLPYGYFTKNKQHNLTPLMIDTLLAACEKQNENVPFGPADIKGSFSALVNRGLIIRKEAYRHQHKELLWQVTREAISMLRILGIIVACGEFKTPESFNLEAYSRRQKALI
jgi:hypothetical protein